MSLANERVALSLCNDDIPPVQVLPTNDVMLQSHRNEFTASWQTPWCRHSPGEQNVVESINTAAAKVLRILPCYILPHLHGYHTEYPFHYHMHVTCRSVIITTNAVILTSLIKTILKEFYQQEKTMTKLAQYACSRTSGHMLSLKPRTVSGVNS